MHGTMTMGLLSIQHFRTSNFTVLFMSMTNNLEVSRFSPAAVAPLGLLNWFRWLDKLGRRFNLYCVV